MYLLTVAVLIVEAQMFEILLDHVLCRCTDLDPVIYEEAAISNFFSKVSEPIGNKLSHA